MKKISFFHCRSSSLVKARMCVSLKYRLNRNQQTLERFLIQNWCNLIAHQRGNARNREQVRFHRICLRVNAQDSSVCKSSIQKCSNHRKSLINISELVHLVKINYSIFCRNNHISLITTRIHLSFLRIIIQVEDFNYTLNALSLIILIDGNVL